MDAIERAAFLSVGRGSGFAGLAIVCVMVGFSFEPRLAAELGGILTLILTLVLAYRAKSSLDRPYWRTEAWLILDEGDRPDRQVAQVLVGRAQRKASLWFARRSAMASVVLLVAAIGFRIVAAA